MVIKTKSANTGRGVASRKKQNLRWGSYVATCIALNLPSTVCVKFTAIQKLMSMREHGIWDFAPFSELQSLVNEPRLPPGRITLYSVQLSHITLSSRVKNKASALARRLI